jgi:hypothetical protein
MEMGMRVSRLTALLAAVVLAAAAGAPASFSADLASAATGVLRTGLPNRNLTPGVTNPVVTQTTIHRTICVSGWTSRIRPPSSYTTPLKRTQLVSYGFTDRTLSHYEEDHLISLELGGSPRSTRNLWPEPHYIRISGGLLVGSYAKDGFENYLRRAVCAGRLRLTTAQYEISRNWVYYWKRAGRPRG